MSNYNFNIIKYSYKHSTARRTKLNITIPNIENPTNRLNSENESCIRYIKKSHKSIEEHLRFNQKLSLIDTYKMCSFQ